VRGAICPNVAKKRKENNLVDVGARGLGQLALLPLGAALDLRTIAAQ